MSLAIRDAKINGTVVQIHIIKNVVVKISQLLDFVHSGYEQLGCNVILNTLYK